MKKAVFTVCVLVIACFSATYVLAGCGACDSGKENPACGATSSEYEKKGSGCEKESAYEKKGSTTCFGQVCMSTAEKGGVKEIAYDQFQLIRNSGEPYVLLDALSKESYDAGHIKGAISFPYSTIDYKSAPMLLKLSDNIIVYCGGFKCSASTKAAHRLQALGYENVVDYKGGLEEWQEKGNSLVQ